MTLADLGINFDAYGIGTALLGIGFAFQKISARMGRRGTCQLLSGSSGLLKNSELGAEMSNIESRTARH